MIWIENIASRAQRKNASLKLLIHNLILGAITIVSSKAFLIYRLVVLSSGRPCEPLRCQMQMLTLCSEMGLRASSSSWRTLNLLTLRRFCSQRILGVTPKKNQDSHSRATPAIWTIPNHRRPKLGVRFMRLCMTESLSRFRKLLEIVQNKEIKMTFKTQKSLEN